MKTRRKSLILVMTALLFLTWLTPALAWEEDNGPPIAFDTFILRPLGVAATLVGVGVFLASLPFSAATGNTDEVAHRYVVEPFRFTFERPVGAPTHHGEWSAYQDSGR